MENFDSLNAVMEKKSIRKVRATFGLPPIEECKSICLRCGNKFKSEDKRSNRICEECKGRQEVDYSEHFIGTEY